MNISRQFYECLECNGVDVRDNYSGRFMCGSVCFAYVDSSIQNSIYNLRNAVQDIADNVDNELCQQEATELLESGALEHSCWDHLGLDYIIYFPEISVG